MITNKMMKQQEGTFNLNRSLCTIQHWNQPTFQAVTLQMRVNPTNFLPMNLIIKTTMWNASPYHDYKDDNKATGGHIHPEPEPSHDPALEPADISGSDLGEESQSEPIAGDDLEHQNNNVEVSEESSVDVAVTAVTSSSSRRHFRQ